MLRQCQFAFSVISPLALGCIKLSILFFYRRVFCGRAFNILSLAFISLVTLWTLSFFFLQLFDCGTHFNVNWGRVSDLQKCLGSFKQLLAFPISDVVIDILIMILPLPLVRIVMGSLILSVLTAPRFGRCTCHGSAS